MIGDETYAIMTGNMDDGFQVISLSDPTNPTPVASATDGANGFDVLYSARKVHVFGGAPYAIVASSKDNGIELIDLSNPANPTPVASAHEDVRRGGVGGPLDQRFVVSARPIPALRARRADDARDAAANLGDGAAVLSAVDHRLVVSLIPHKAGVLEACRARRQRVEASIIGAVLPALCV